jgi:hypothetical protein
LSDRDTILCGLEKLHINNKEFLLVEEELLKVVVGDRASVRALLVAFFA